jgi:choline dehydrogenase
MVESAPDLQNAEAFDYIVVGAGSAGCVVAARLSESGRASVLVLEAGGPDTHPWIHVPIGFGKTFFDERVNWCYTTETGPGIDGRRIFMPCGRVLGGSSSINGLVFQRGQREDFDHWQREGNPGWSYEDVLPFFRKLEDWEHGEDVHRGVGGPLAVSALPDVHPLSHAFVDGAVALGHARIGDLNGAERNGAGYFQVTVRNGRRVSSARAFLRAAERRSHVSVRTRAEVECLHTENGQVTGLTYHRGGASFAVRARRSVVLCAGSLNSPAILQRSGIGRGAWLQEAGIAVRHELPGVGANLHDHVQARLVLRSVRHPTLNTLMQHPLRRLVAGLQYALFRRGPMTFAGGQSGGFFDSRGEGRRPDVVLLLMPLSSLDYRQGLDQFAGFSVSCGLLRPRSRGTLRVRSPHYRDAPLIQPNYLAESVDGATLVDALRLARRIAAAGPLRQEIDAEMRPGPGVQSDEALLAYVRASAGSIYHPVGTCRMGPRADAHAVVDARLRVHGLAGLTVADASVMPSIVSAPTNATAVMIGERAADFLLQETR